MKKNIGLIVVISALVLMFVIFIFRYQNLAKEYKALKFEYNDLSVKKELLEKQINSLESALKNVKKSSKLSNKSANEIASIRYQEIQEKLNTFGLKSSEITTYWGYIQGWFNSFEIYPCIEFELVNTSKKRLDSIIINVSFDSNFGDATVIVDNLHPGRSKIIHLKSSICKKVNGLNVGNIPNIEANVKMTINDKTESSIGFIQITKEYRQLK